MLLRLHFGVIAFACGTIIKIWSFMSHPIYATFGHSARTLITKTCLTCLTLTFLKFGIFTMKIFWFYFLHVFSFRNCENVWNFLLHARMIWLRRAKPLSRQPSSFQHKAASCDRVDCRSTCCVRNPATIRMKNELKAVCFTTAFLNESGFDYHSRHCVMTLSAGLRLENAVTIFTKNGRMTSGFCWMRHWCRSEARRRGFLWFGFQNSPEYVPQK